MVSVLRGRGWIALIACVLWGIAAAAGCGSKGGSGSFEAPGIDASTDGASDATSGGKDGSTPADSGGGDAPTFGSVDAGPTTLSISPGSPAAAVTITNGVLSTNPIPLQALATNANGSVPVAAAWSFDRGELGTVSAAGVFTASGNLSGVGTVTAVWNGLTASAKLTVSLTVVQNGGSTASDGGAPEAGAGGIGGVGGSGPGGPVSASTQGLLTGTPTQPDGGAELGWLYPYDQTVWPRGILAPLLQWATTHTISAVYIQLTENNYQFQGFYSGSALVNQPVDANAWLQATYGNQGDKLHVSLVVTDGTTAWGPISEDWLIAPGVLQGTVYYGSYNSTLAGSANGAVLAIRPGATAPTVAIPGTQTTCNVCHEVSWDGSTLVMQNQTTADSYGDGTSYDLTKDGGVIATYPGPGSSASYEKFAWSALYPDGTFALANGGGNTETREGYAGPSQLFKRSDGSAIPTSGFTTAVTNAATPIFSVDGREVAFNYWTGTATNGVSPGAGHNLVMMDFDCGQAEGGTGCSGSPPYTFANLRQIYSDSSRYPGWPSFLPDTSGLLFHNTLVPGYEGPDCSAGGGQACYLTTWEGAQAEIWWSNTTPSSGGTAQPVRLDAMNGVVNGGSYLPANASHPNDSVLNYEPTVNPIASGGYFWVVFTSRRMYGNVAAGDPYDGGNGTYPIPKKLWVAALDINGTAGKDISHPAFYLPGQELNAGNLRGFWVVNPCQADGTSCLTGDECCNGFCRQGEAGGLVCTTQPPGCSNEYEKCSTTADCCGAAQGFQCINGRCASPGSQ